VTTTQTRYFNRVLRILEDLGRIEANNFSSDWRKIVSLDFGFDLSYGLGPRLKLVKDPELSSAESREFVSDLDQVLQSPARIMRKQNRPKQRLGYGNTDAENSPSPA